ncbi:Uncharacterised protein [Vibrio cholerae]|nr:Uncharacterised protein [Vibrio cholerae]
MVPALLITTAMRCWARFNSSTKACSCSIPASLVKSALTTRCSSGLGSD